MKNKDPINWVLIIRNHKEINEGGCKLLRLGALSGNPYSLICLKSHIGLIKVLVVTRLNKKYISQALNNQDLTV